MERESTLAAARIRPVPAVSRAVAILRLLAASEAPQGVNAIARALGLVPSTCLHILRALVAERLVAVDPATKRYMLDVGMLSLARGALSRSGLAGLVQPRLDALAAAHGVTAIAVRVSGLEHMVVLAISRADPGLRLHVEVGSRFPALISATGRCLAAFGGHAWDEMAARFARLRWHRAPTLEQWRAEVEQTRRDGHAIDDGNYIAGICILAAPVLGMAGSMTHAIVAVGVAEQLRAESRAALVADLKETATAVSGL